MKRRDFLVTAGSIGLAVMGGSEWARGATSAPCPPPNVQLDSESAVSTSCDAASVTSFNLVSAAGGTLLPFTIGHRFGEGISRRGSSSRRIWERSGRRSQSLVGRIGQVAVLSGRKTLAPNAAATVTVKRTGSLSGGTPLAEAALVAAAPSAQVELSGFGTVKLSSLLGSPVRSILGAEMSEFHYRSAVGGDAHLAVWFYVRYYNASQIEIETCVENGYMKVASPTDKTYTATITINGTVRYSASLTHWPRTRWMTINWYDGENGLTDFTRVIPSHDHAYLRSTKVVPNYSVAPNAAYLNSVYQAITPLSNGSLTGGSLAGAGSSDHIGIMPRWDAAYCVTGDARAYKSVVANAYAANSWPVCYRDESTQRPLALTTRPNLDAAGWNVDPVADGTGSNGNSFGAGTVAHMPGSGYLGYLITGRWTHLETVAFWAARTHMQSNPTSRGLVANNGGGASINLSEDRGRAWALRTQMMAISLYPDAGPTPADTKVRTDWLAAMPGTLSYWQNNGLNCPLGYPSNMYNPGAYSPAEAVLPALAIPIWQGDFIAQCFGFTWDLDVLSGAGKASHQVVRDHTYKVPIGRMGDSTTWCYRQGLPYAPVVGTLDPAHNGDASFIVWDASWAAAWNHSAATGAVDGTQTCSLGTSIINGHFPDATSYGANFTPAIVYAVDHGAPGAAVAYSRFTNASNYGAFVSDQVNATQWAVLPR